MSDVTKALARLSITRENDTVIRLRPTGYTRLEARLEEGCEVMHFEPEIWR
jgi:hypothetical protein